ncbi:hypothetical protein [Xylanimonas sp. McL0601]|uniref:hypothetical protein n=1 Tax=Xylanimonas sp. McL0601 TaxID=3414739 RepID=UPI003CF47D0F
MTAIPRSCEPLGPELWLQPASAWTSLAFVVAGAAIVWAARHPAPVRADDAAAASDAARLRTTLGIVTVLIGGGSVIQHGPAPSWNPVVHDPPLMAAVCLAGADAVADLTGRRLRHWWWLAPTGLVVVLAARAPGASSAVQGVAAAVAVGATLVRAWGRPVVRSRLLVVVGLLGAGGVIGNLSETGGPWCDPSSAWFQAGWSGHAVWHALAAVALWVLAPALGTRRGRLHPA